MNDPDRLRKAADKVLWDSTFLQESDFPELQNERRQKERVAALLRAIGDATQSDIDNFGGIVMDSRPFDAALALAETILGGSDD